MNGAVFFWKGKKKYLLELVSELSETETEDRGFCPQT